MEAHDLRAPSADGGLLAVPPLDAVPALLAEDRARLEGWEYDVQGRPAARLRTLARRQVLEAAAAYHARMGLEPVAPDDHPSDVPLLVSGHQPELFHPGVWAKNFALAAMADRSGGRALNLIVDNDVPRSPSIRVPGVMADGALRVRPVEFDVWGGELPYEDWAVRDEALFASFPDRVREALGGLVTDPVLDAFWPHIREASERTDRIGLRFAAARRALEAEWGVHNAEVPLSAVCETEAFAWFAAHLLAQLPRFQAVHNAALLAYRRRYGIRSTHHPVPALEERDGWREAPFWAWRARGAVRRRPLLARQADARTVQLRIQGESQPFAELPLGPDREACCAVERLVALPADGIRLRTRALTTTMFSRLFLGDLFLHGIGGAKYDELGDAVLRGFFGIDPPGYATLSLTVRLGLPESPATPEARRAALRRLRDLAHQPERHLPPGASADLVAAKRAALDLPQGTHRQRRARWAELRRLTEALAAPLAGDRARLAEELAALDRGLAHNALARGRDFAFVLHGRARLRAAFAAMLRD